MENNSFEMLDALLSLHNKKCQLFHVKDEILPDAVDFLVQNLGTNGTITERLQIPICQECLEALQSSEWVLLVCTQCLESRWVNRRLSKRVYDKNLYWLKQCPECINDN